MDVTYKYIFLNLKQQKELLVVSILLIFQIDNTFAQRSFIHAKHELR